MKRILLTGLVAWATTGCVAQAHMTPLTWPEAAPAEYEQAFDVVGSPAANAAQFDAPMSCTTDWRGFRDCTVPDEGVAGNHRDCEHKGRYRFDCPVSVWLGDKSNVVATATIRIRKTHHGIRGTWWWTQRPRSSPPQPAGDGS